MTEDEMVGWHHQLSGHEAEQTPGDSEGRGAWRATVHGVAELDTTEPLKNNSSIIPLHFPTYEIIQCPKV